MSKPIKSIGRLTNKAGGIATPSGTDILFQNTFIRQNYDEVPPEQLASFRRYKEEQDKKLEKAELIEKARRHSASVTPNIEYEKTQQKVGDGVDSLVANEEFVDLTEDDWEYESTPIFIDSADRNKKVYPSPSDYKFYTGRTFSNVTKIELKGLIFPNVDQAINETCNKMRWINKEDYMYGYPTYVASVARGSYTVSTIGTELDRRLNTPLIKRENGNGSAHDFVIDISTDTDLVSFTSIKATKANSVMTRATTGIIRVQHPNHGYQTGDTIYVRNVRGVVGGINSIYINGVFTITYLNNDEFTYEIAQISTETVTGGGNMIRTGKATQWQLLADSNDTILERLGFPLEHSNESLNVLNPLTSVSKPITGAASGSFTTLTVVNHQLLVGDVIYLHNCLLNPNIYNDPRHKGMATVTRILTEDQIQINFASSGIVDVSQAVVGTRLMRMTFPNHGFNMITDIRPSTTDGWARITTMLPHNIDITVGVYLSGTNALPSIDGFYPSYPDNDIATKYKFISADTFEIKIAPLILTQNGFEGSIVSDQKFRLYGVQPFGGFTSLDLNATEFQVREVINANEFWFTVQSGFSDALSMSGGGGGVRIHSKIHGWAGTHDNHPNGILHQPIRLIGNNYAYLCMPNNYKQGLINSNKIDNVLCVAYLRTSPGYVTFGEFLTEPMKFDPPLQQLGEIHLEFKDPDGFYLEFNGFEYQCALVITEKVPKKQKPLKSRPL